jgi:hypothetical protein
MKFVSYIITIKGEPCEITVTPDQTEIVVRAMQRLTLKIKRFTPFDVEMVKEEIEKWPYKKGEFWLSDRSIKQVIQQCDDRPGIKYQ